MENAIIDSVFLGLEGHGIPSIMVDLDFGGVHQGFGGYDLRYKDMAAKWILGLCRVTECDDVTDIKGRVVRVERDGRKVIGIGHPVKDVWFRVSELPT